MRALRLLLVPALIALAGFWQPTKAPEAPTREVLNWTIDKAHSSIGFRVRHLGISFVNGVFEDYDATLQFDPNDLSTLKATATIRVASINTGIERRDNHLRSPDFFDAEKYPEIRFVSKEVRNIQGNRFQLVGDLTIKDVTKEVVLDVEFLGTAQGMQGELRTAFTARGTIDRFDYGLQWNQLTEAGGVVVGREVTLLIDIEAVQEGA
ncbi:YceI family protein [Rhodothermus marinus SG0.5JP17-172]|uniref:YceI family protein n=1 Tax=Rhodothermus marinus TaxID=29549 RepID=UPI000223DC1A|nr:YceI family protein [Rhodothermus marinus]AEN74202.1 YceI family protein [Rhodothermus marinus SG0.5JP17-172]MBO2490821.1 polyisoprenoid-binding protein [Rhodothermus marinus]